MQRHCQGMEAGSSLSRLLKISKNNVDRFVYRGRIRSGRCTKEMVRRIRPGEIALISHRDLDELAVESLLKSRARVVLNTDKYISGLFANSAPRRLLEKGVYLLEEVDERIFDLVRDGDMIRIRGKSALSASGVEFCGTVFTEGLFEERMAEARRRAFDVAAGFFDNTLVYARREKELLLGKTEIPPLQTKIKGRDVVVVVRGRNYREDLHILHHYLKEARPVLIGVDGGADALWEAGYRPDIIVGDMDSVSTPVLRKAGEIVVHAYPDGRRSPGIERVEKLGLHYSVYTIPGTSEDIALLLAYDQGAELIVALGTHFGVMEFLQKGRRGMSSTLLVRLKVADRLVDAKGVSRLYRRGGSFSLLSVVFLAGLLPVIILLLLSPLVQHFFRVILWRMGIGL